MDKGENRQMDATKHFAKEWSNPIFRTGFSILFAKGFSWVGGPENLSERIVKFTKPLHMLFMVLKCHEFYFNRTAIEIVVTLCCNSVLLHATICLLSEFPNGQIFRYLNECNIRAHYIDTYLFGAREFLGCRVVILGNNCVAYKYTEKSETKMSPQ